jgi:hypothetical protein
VHSEAFEWVARYAAGRPVAVLDIGGRDINGTVRSLFPNATVYTVLDIADGPNVDIVADAATWIPDREYDVVVCCEVFEHTAVWPAICRTAHQTCVTGGRFITTMAGPGRAPHSAVDGGARLFPGEHYENVEPLTLRRVLEDCGWRNIVMDWQPGPADVRAVASK